MFTLAEYFAVTVATYVSFLRFSPEAGPKLAGERKTLRLHKRPVATLCYFAGVVHEFLYFLRKKYFSNKTLLSLAFAASGIYSLSLTGGPEDFHNQIIRLIADGRVGEGQCRVNFWQIAFIKSDVNNRSDYLGDFSFFDSRHIFPP